MIDTEEHWYDDDPAEGHPDARTRLPGVSYFFLGNGLIQAALQVAPKGEGTPLGLLIMDPDVLGRKRDALSMHPSSGLENTMLRLRVEGGAGDGLPVAPEARWTREAGVPAVRAGWTAGALEVSELSFCPDRSHAALCRQARIRNRGTAAVALTCITGVLDRSVEETVTLEPGQETELAFLYTLRAGLIDLQISPGLRPQDDALEYWFRTAAVSFNSPLLDRCFEAARCQLPAAISRNGVVDGGIWQYNREWVRDQSFMVAGLCLSGHHELAGTQLGRLLDDFVSDEGDTIDSSELREPEDVELDQNGALLYALATYVHWTGDLELAARRWPRIVKLAEFPLRETFRHPASGLVHNQRDYWERHSVFGIEDGMELGCQVFTSLGLESAASLARLLAHHTQARRWQDEAARFRRTLLGHPKFALVDERGFIKRRRLDGTVQETATPRSETGLPAEVPLMAAGEHRLNPDTQAALPVAFGLVPPDSPVAAATLDSLELLWNQGWKDGGYGRYHMTSEPDSPGAWPFASLFVARACLEAGRHAEVWRVLEWLRGIPGGEAGAWFENYGPRIAPPFPQVGIVPWIWAELLLLLVHQVLGVRPGESGILIRPRLLPGVELVTASMPLRGRSLRLELRRGDHWSFETTARGTSEREGEFLIDWAGEDIALLAHVPRHPQSRTA